MMKIIDLLTSLFSLFKDLYARWQAYMDEVAKKKFDDAEQKAKDTGDTSDIDILLGGGGGKAAAPKTEAQGAEK